MTIYKSIQPLANGAVDAAIKLARGVCLQLPTPSRQWIQERAAILLEPVAVDRANLVSTVVKDGYQTLAAICAGLPPDKCPKGL